MALLKIARTQNGEHNIDDYIDSCGYAAIAGEITENRYTSSKITNIFKKDKDEQQ